MSFIGIGGSGPSHEIFRSRSCLSALFAGGENLAKDSEFAVIILGVCHTEINF